MALGTFTPDYPNQNLGAGDTLALAIAEFTGIVEGTIERKSALKGFITPRAVKGTSTITNEGIGESTLQVIVPGTVPDGTVNQNARINLTVDTTILARTIVPLLDNFQKNYDVKAEIGREHGKKIAKFWDTAHFIQAAKAAGLGSSAFGALPGHFGGSTKTLTNASDATDPAALLLALSDLFVQFQNKDVDPATDDVIVALRPASFMALLDSEQIVRTDYLTSRGTKIEGGYLLKAYGVPVMASNNVPNTNITAHELSNVRNSNAYNGDFTKLVAVAFSQDALLAGETIPLTSSVFYEERDKCWYIDSHVAFGVVPNRAEFAGRILLP